MKNMKVWKIGIVLLLLCAMVGTAGAIDISGGVTSSVTYLDVDGATYDLTGDIYANQTAFAITADNITLDGHGFNVIYGATYQGSQSFGVVVSSRKNVIIKNINVSHGEGGDLYSNACAVQYSDNCSILNSTFSTNADSGVYLKGATNTLVKNVTIPSSGYGITFRDGANNNTVEQCSVDICGFLNYVCLDIQDSNYNNVSSCSFSGNEQYGMFTKNTIGNIFTDCNFSSVNGYGFYMSTATNNCNFSNCSFISSIYNGIKILQSTGNSFTNTTVVSPVSSAPHASNHILMMGDSISEGGAGDIVPLGAWGLNLSVYLNQYQPWYVSCAAASGERADEGRAKFISELEIYDPDIVTLLYGCNDIDDLRAEQDIIDDVLWMAQETESRGKKPYILTTTPVENTDFNACVVAYDTNLTSQATAAGYTVINVYDAIDSTPQNGEYDDYVSALHVDSVHPNNAGNELIANMIYQQLVSDYFPVAQFTASPTSGAAPLTVQFTDTSIGTPTSWLWNFGDGETSTLQNPTHTYDEAGIYTVSLTVTNDAGSDILIRTDYITVNPDFTQSSEIATGTVPIIMVTVLVIISGFVISALRGKVEVSDLVTIGIALMVLMAIIYMMYGIGTKMEEVFSYI